jgi:hypothetical protein
MRCGGCWQLLLSIGTKVWTKVSTNNESHDRSSLPGVTVFSGVHHQNFACTGLLMARLLPQKPRQQNLRCTSKILTHP